jgi:hypothetical protein
VDKWPASNRNGGRLQVGIPGRIKSESAPDGGAGNDTLIAGKSHAVLIGGAGDILTGSKGEDTFIFTGNFGPNTVTNFNPHKDMIALDHSEFANLHAVMTSAHQVGADITIDGRLVYLWRAVDAEGVSVRCRPPSDQRKCVTSFAH